MNITELLITALEAPEQQIRLTTELPEGMSISFELRVLEAKQGDTVERYNNPIGMYIEDPNNL